MSLALKVDNLTKVYRKTAGLLRRGESVKVVDGLSLNVPSGEIYGFLGLNGAGKTTTIKVVMGFIDATAGSVEIFGEPAVRPQSRRMLGFAPERTAFYDYLTAGEVLEFLGGLSGLTGRELATRIPELLSMVALDGKRDVLVRNFSKGMQQRLGIAQSLLGDPRLLLFDEPTTGLDPLGRKMFKDLVLRLKAEGRTVFFSSHQLPDVQEICSQVGIIHNGKLVYEGPVSALLKEGGALEARFIHLIAEVDGQKGRATVPE